MDPRLLRYYNQELGHLREMGGEFARQFPKLAARLGMEGIEVTDPYVERLMEGAAFLAARVQLKIDAEFPRFTQRLLEIVYPTYLAPTPSMLVAQFTPDPDEPNLARGFVVPRGSSIRNNRGMRDPDAPRPGTLDRDDRTPCEFRTAHDVRLYPVELTAAEYFTYAPDLPLTALPIAKRIRGGVRLKWRATAGMTFDQIALDTLRIHLAGADETAFKLHELIVGSPLGVIVAPDSRPWKWYEFVPAAGVRRVGFAEDEALLPPSLRVFNGYRLLQEYFAFPHRYLFVDLEGLGKGVSRHRGGEIEIVILLGDGDPALEKVVDARNFLLHCAPAINLFPKRAERIHVESGAHEFHVVPDRTRPLDFEIYEVTGVTGFGVGAGSERAFLPFYAAYHAEATAEQAYFAVQREPRLLSEAQRRNGFRSSYVGSELFLSLVDTAEVPFAGDLRQLAVTTLCTNRDLPMSMALGGADDFTLDSAAPVAAIRAVKGPSRPHSPVWEGGTAWRFINHLSLNYLSLVDASDREGAAALREMLALYAATSDAGVRKQVDGVRSVRVERVVRRLPAAGPISFGRGLAIELEVDELAFQGGSAFLFGSVMEQFFARYVSINAFTETVLRSTSRGIVKRWVPRWGGRQIL